MALSGSKALSAPVFTQSAVSLAVEVWPLVVAAGSIVTCRGRRQTVKSDVPDRRPGCDRNRLPPGQLMAPPLLATEGSSAHAIGLVDSPHPPGPLVEEVRLNDSQATVPSVSRPRRIFQGRLSLFPSFSSGRRPSARGLTSSKGLRPSLPTRTVSCLLSLPTVPR